MRPLSGDAVPRSGEAAAEPLLLVDVDGVVSLFGFDPAAPPEGSWLLIEGMPHLLSDRALRLLERLGRTTACAWCSGWDEKASDHLLPWPHVPLVERRPGQHWKLAAIDAYAGRERPLAWVDDRHDDTCRAWARARPGPTLLVATDPAVGLGEEHARVIAAWLSRMRRARSDPSEQGRRPPKYPVEPDAP